jgi:hypothetical protein
VFKVCVSQMVVRILKLYFTFCLKRSILEKVFLQYNYVIGYVSDSASHCPDSSLEDTSDRMNWAVNFFVDMLVHNT